MNKDIYGVEESVEPADTSNLEEQEEFAPDTEIVEEQEDIETKEQESEEEDEDLEADFDNDEDYDIEEEEDEEGEESIEQEKPLEEDKPKKKELTQEDIDKIVQKRIDQENKSKKKAKKEKSLIERIAKDALKGIAPANENSLEAMKQVAADNLGITLEEYESQLKQEEELAEYKEYKETQEKQKKNQEVNTIKSMHLQEIKSIDPKLKATKIEDIPNFAKFAALMRTEMFSAKEAYKATRALEKPESNAEEEYEKQRALRDSKNHMRSTKPRTVAPRVKPIPQSDYEAYRAAYPDLTERELIKKYHASKNL